MNDYLENFFMKHFLQSDLITKIDIKKTRAEYNKTNKEHIYQSNKEFIDYENFNYNSPPSFKEFINELENLKEVYPEYFL